MEGQVTIAERLSRRNADDVIYLGDLVERHMFSGGQPTELLQLMKALTEGRAESEAFLNNGQSADRILGRIEMCYRLINDIQQFIIDKDMAKTPQDAPLDDRETPIAAMPEVKTGGTI